MTLLILKCSFISKHLHPSRWQHLTQDRPLLWFLSAVFLSSCFRMFPTDSPLITVCIAPLCFVHAETGLTALCMCLYLIEAERINVAISPTPQYHTGCRTSWVRSSLSALCKMWKQSWSGSAPLLLLSLLWCSPSVCSMAPSSAGISPALSLCGATFLTPWCMILYQTMLIEWAIWQHTWRVPWASSLQQLREKMDAATGTQKSGENLDVVGLAPPFSLGDAKGTRSHLLSFLHVCWIQRQKHSSQN